MKKKFLSIALALVLALSMGTVAFAAGDDAAAGADGDVSSKNTDANFDKTYTLENPGTSNPAETFIFKFTPVRVTDSNKNLTMENMPNIPNSTINFGEGTATVAPGETKKVDVALSTVTWPGVGIYYYKVNEVVGKTAGVTYSEVEAWLKVTVAYDDTTNAYYTAFVTLNLDEKDSNGNTANKTAGFTNKYSAGSLSITKTVTGNMGDRNNTYFEVDVTLTGEADKTYKDSYPASTGSSDKNPSTIKIGEKTTFWLKHGDTITISNLPYGVTYTVEEHDYTTTENGGYDKADYAYSDNGKNTDNLVDTSAEKVTITNNKGTKVDTGVFLDSMPYVLLLAVVGVGAIVFFTKKKREN